MRAIHSLVYGEMNLDESQEPFIPGETSQNKGGNWVSNHFNNQIEEEDFLNDDI